MQIEHEAKVYQVRQTRTTKSGTKKLELPYGQISLRDKKLGQYIGQKLKITITTKEDAQI